MEDFTQEELEVMRDSMVSMLDVCNQDRIEFYQGIIDKLNKLIK